MASGRGYFIGGNWKCNGTKQSVSELVSVLNTFQFPTEQNRCNVVVFPSSLHVPYVVDQLKNGFQVGVQDIGANDKNGAYTGIVSCDMVKDFGMNWVIVGHSERRKLYNEDVNLAAEKAKIALSKGLKVVFCIGEQLSERENNQTMQVVYSQLEPLIAKISPNDWANVVIAYEPVWAIGTGVVATPEQAQEVHYALRQWFSEKLDTTISTNLQIVYGGSVKGSNCQELAKQADIDGFLVGGASLKKEYIDICQITSKQYAEQSSL